MRGTLTVGDWSKDGHNQEETFEFEVTGDVAELTGEGCPEYQGDKRLQRHPTWGCATVPNLWAYYRKGVEVTGFDVTKYCEDYEDSHIPLKLGLALLPAMFADLDLAEGECEDESIDDALEVYPELWVAIVNRGIDEMGINATVKIVPRESRIIYNIGGYGLFWN